MSDHLDYLIGSDCPEGHQRFAFHNICECRCYEKRIDHTDYHGSERIGVPGLAVEGFNGPPWQVEEINVQFMQERYGIKRSEYLNWLRRRA